MNDLQNAFYDLIVFGPGDDVRRLRYLAEWLDRSDVVWTGGGPPDEAAMGVMRVAAQGMAAGFRWLAAEMEYDAAGSPRGWRKTQ